MSFKNICALLTLIAAILAVVTAENSNAFAQERRADDYGGWVGIRIERHLEFEGYRDGISAGRSDAYARRPMNPRESKFFRDGNEEYREGFNRGYDEGYGRAKQRMAEKAANHFADDGYQDGLNCGRSDAISRHPANLEGSRYFRDGNVEYREAFRRGYNAGFHQGEQRLAAITDARMEGDGYQDGIAIGRNDALARRAARPEAAKYFQDGSGEYRNGFRRGYSDGYRQGEQRLAAKAQARLSEDGYQDGLTCGRRDALAYRPPDPGRSRAFRDGAGEYREGFQRGYSEGFREGLRNLER